MKRVFINMLTTLQKKILIQKFPEVELSYDNLLHRKVYANVYMVIPKGPKAFLWITYVEDKNVAILIILDNKDKIKTMDVYPMCFDKILSLGTLIYGTSFSVGQRKHFSCEDIFFYKGCNIKQYSFSEKFRVFKEMFDKYLSQIAFNNNFLIAGIPICCPNYQQAISNETNLPYKIYGIRLYNLRHKTSQSLGIYIPKEKFVVEAIFRVKASIENDIYNLYCFEPNNFTEPYSSAAVTSYKQSVMLNNLFRTIKENSNLDLLEESDDEEEFENINSDKFVNLNKQIIMKCVYKKQFQKWEPIEVIKDKVKLITRKEAQLLEKKV
tara:strand:- start:772 stop:1743 length:972 start_codon:yes stop_codon:yes gene_type:complete